MTSRQSRDVSSTFALSTEVSLPRRAVRELAPPRARRARSPPSCTCTRPSRARHHPPACSRLLAEVDPARELAHDDEIDARAARSALSGERAGERLVHASPDADSRTARAPCESPSSPCSGRTFARGSSHRGRRPRRAAPRRTPCRARSSRPAAECPSRRSRAPPISADFELEVVSPSLGDRVEHAHALARRTSGPMPSPGSSAIVLAFSTLPRARARRRRSRVSVRQRDSRAGRCPAACNASRMDRRESEALAAGQRERRCSRDRS